MLVPPHRYIAFVRRILLSSAGWKSVFKTSLVLLSVDDEWELLTEQLVLEKIYYTKNSGNERIIGNSGFIATAQCCDVIIAK